MPVYCTSCKETLITATDSVEIEINDKVDDFQHGIDTYFGVESMYPYECTELDFKQCFTLVHYYCNQKTFKICQRNEHVVGILSKRYH